MSRVALPQVREDIAKRANRLLSGPARVRGQVRDVSDQRRAGPGFREHSGVVFRVAERAAMGNRALAEDATQQVFIEAVRLWPGSRNWRATDLDVVSCRKRPR